MRIFHCIPSMLNGGAQRQLTYLAAEQVQQGYDVHVALLYNGPNLERLQASKATLHWLSAYNNHDPRLLWQLIQLIRQVKPDIVQTWINQMDVMAGLAAELTGTPWVLSERSSAQNYPDGFKTSLRLWVGAKADAIVANSTGGNMYWVERLRKPTNHYIIPNSIPFNEIEHTAPISTERIALAPAHKMVLYVGRMSPEKNLEILSAAIEQAANEVSLTAYYCGDGTHLEETKKFIKDNNLSELIRVIGYTDEVWAWMKRADMFISISTHEGRPNTVLEAMACPLPVVVSNIPAHQEILDNDSAIIVDPHNPAEIAQAIVTTLSDPAAAQCRAQTAHQKIQQWSITEIAKAYKAVYHSVRQ